MPHFAKLDESNVVTFVTVGRPEDDGKEGEVSARSGETFKQTSYNTYGGVHYTDGVPSADQSKALRFNYAGLGFTYDSERDAFIPPKPSENAVLDEATCLWQAPVDMPDDGQDYTWDESVGEWVVSE